jgi:hypothetical protein
MLNVSEVWKNKMYLKNKLYLSSSFTLKFYFKFHEYYSAVILTILSKTYTVVLNSST